jgi:chromosome segregation ATPase
MDAIKHAFTKAKQDIFDLQSQISSLSTEISEIKRTLNKLKLPTQEVNNQTDRHIIPTDNYPPNPVKSTISPFSIGNEGVPTDRQTHQQTDRHIPEVRLNQSVQHKQDSLSHIDKVSEVLDSLDSIKKEIRYKFKKLTEQEMVIFSSIYQLESEGFSVDYALLASKLALSESSIRDYVLKIIKKGVPVTKTKLNNKKISLSIQTDFKKIASLSTIMRLREI